LGAAFGPFYGFGRRGKGLFFRLSAGFFRVWTAGRGEFPAGLSVAHGALIKKWG